jgi:2-hydroxychromene-2-carboxylate isomerase
VSAFVHAGLKAVWADELNIEDPDTLVRLATRNGLDGARLIGESADPKLHAAEAALTKEAIDRQLFGAPFYFYRNEPFWGQDRLDELEFAIRSQRPPIVPPGPDDL